MRLSNDHAECVRAKRSCVPLSWGSLDTLRFEYQQKVEEGEALLSQVTARLLEEKKSLSHVQKTMRRKAECLALELEAMGEHVWVEQYVHFEGA